MSHELKITCHLLIGLPFMENLTVPFSPASRSLANILITTEFTGVPAHTCTKSHINIFIPYMHLLDTAIQSYKCLL